MPSNSINEPKIRRKAFEDTMSLITREGLDLFIAEIEAIGTYGDYLEEKHIRQCLRQFFGIEGTELLLRQIEIKNAELNNLAEA
jgi:hypothetical protein